MQTWQAFFLGSLAVISLQGIVVYSQMPELEPDKNIGNKKDTKTDLATVLEQLQNANVEWSAAEDVLTGLSTAPGTSYAASMPLAAVYPRSTKDVVAVVKACKDSKIRTHPHDSVL